MTLQPVDKPWIIEGVSQIYLFIHIIHIIVTVSTEKKTRKYCTDNTTLVSNLFPLK